MFLVSSYFGDRLLSMPQSFELFNVVVCILLVSRLPIRHDVLAKARAAFEPLFAVFDQKLRVAGGRRRKQIKKTVQQKT